MIDRIPVNILENGAIKYGIYDESGNLLRYEYIKNEDGAVTTGTALNKANLLSDTVAATIKLATEQASNPETVSSALGLIAGVVGANGVRIATGSYTGTGTYGQANPCSLTFDFPPKLVVIAMRSSSTTGGYPWVSGQSLGRTYLVAECHFSRLTWGGKTLSWYADGASAGQYGAVNAPSAQLNESNKIYDYVVLG